LLQDKKQEENVKEKGEKTGLPDHQNA